MAKGEAKERAVEEGLRWAQVHAAAYEAQVVECLMCLMCLMYCE